MKEKIDIHAYSSKIIEALGKGILLNSQSQKFNTMVIGWGALGICWSKPTFTVYVRENRFTKHQLDESGEFTISIPLGEIDPTINQICGLESGRDIDKVEKAGLTLVEPEVNHTPGIKEYPLTIECKILYAQKQDLALLPKEIYEHSYPQDVDGTYPMANRDAHTAYIGEIVSAYIIKDE